MKTKGIEIVSSGEPKKYLRRVNNEILVCAENGRILEIVDINNQEHWAIKTLKSIKEGIEQDEKNRAKIASEYFKFRNTISKYNI